MKLRIPHASEPVAKRQTLPAPAVAVAQQPVGLPGRDDTRPIDRRGLFSPVRPLQARSGDSISR
jgi:hypothetical protein